MRFVFEGRVFLWEARTQTWCFVALPVESAEEIREIPRSPRGFGAVRVEARIGTSTWRTSIFPDTDTQSYVLPLRRSVRDAESFGPDDVVSVELTVLDG